MADRIELMKLALGYKVASDIIGADDDIAPAERAFLMTHFPYRDLQEAGFVSPSGDPTPRLAKFLDEAIIAIPTAVPLAERLKLFDTFVDAVAADGDLNPGEEKVLRQGATMLGLSEAQVDARLDSHPAVGQVDLGAPE
ncbi:MAG: TerB family tellurite resistance protein [Proteobacteria bacterium]|nr:TerB family tellurite resistance protein [Pseudomonadota bacterium]